MALCPSFPVALAARVLGGLTHAVFWITIGGYVGRIVAPDRVGRALTVVFGGGNLGVLLGIPAGTALGVAIGWRATFGVLAVVAVALAWRCCGCCRSRVRRRRRAGPVGAGGARARLSSR